MVSLMLFASVSVTACGGRGGDEIIINKDKSQLNIGVFDAGYGSAWAYETAADFEALYANTSFEEGKMGVQVVIDPKKAEFTTTTLTSTMAGKNNAMYYLSNFQYDAVQSAGLVADITDAINAKVYDANGELAMMDDGKGKLIPIKGRTASLSMYDRANDEVKDLYLESDGKYYGAPWAGVISSIIYDADLFSARKYFSDSKGNFNKTLADVEEGDCGPGPDGEMGTADDGMPETYAAFLKLLLKMRDDDVIPFTWSGMTPYQRNGAFGHIYANYQGAEGYAENFASDRTFEKLAEHEGRKAAIQFFSDIVKGEHYATNAFTQSYTDAQSNYINSIDEEKPIAFFFEGSYWESETRRSFDEMAKDDANMGYGKRNFKFFPVPNFVGTPGITDQTNTKEKEVLCGTHADAIVFITEKNTCENPELQKRLAKLFMQFNASREQNVKTIKNTGGCIPMYDYKIEESEVKTLTKFGQDIFRYMEEGSKIVWCTEFQEDTFNTLRFMVRYNGIQFYDCASIFNKNPDLSVADCFNENQKAIRALN